MAMRRVGCNVVVAQAHVGFKACQHILSGGVCALSQNKRANIEPTQLRDVSIIILNPLGAWTTRTSIGRQTYAGTYVGPWQIIHALLHDTTKKENGSSACNVVATRAHVRLCRPVGKCKLVGCVPQPK